VTDSPQALTVSPLSFRTRTHPSGSAVGRSVVSSSA
jgi:hypothetical protein